MAGVDPRFPSQAFRDAVRFAMQMGRANAPSQVVTFRRPTTKTFTASDPGGYPYNWSQPATTNTTYPDVQVDCAVEWVARPSETRDTSVGQFDTPRATIWVFDEDMDAIEDYSEVLIGGDLYKIDSIGPPATLFDVEFYPILATAVDASASV